MLLTVGLLWLSISILRTNPEGVYIFNIAEYNKLLGVFSLDRLSGFFVVVSGVLNYICVSIYNAKNYNQLVYLLVFLFLCFFLVHTFITINMLTFYVMFETTMVPMVMLIILWGARQRKLHAMYMFFFYTIFGSVFLLLGLLGVFFLSGSLLVNSVNCIEFGIFSSEVYLLWLSLLLGFGCKVPIVPMHTWLPEAHVEAPTVGSIILAGLLLKVGTFGLLRFMFPSFNAVSYLFQSLIFMLSLFGLYYTSLIATRQLDMKKIIAYSSIAHMGFVILGLFSITFFGFLGAYFTMLSHGIVAPSLFFLIGVLYERYGSRIILNYGGLVATMPLYSTVFFLLILANMALPLTSNFVGEFFILLGLYTVNLFAGVVAAFSVVLVPIYSL